MSIETNQDNLEIELEADDEEHILNIINKNEYTDWAELKKELSLS